MSVEKSGSSPENSVPAVDISSLPDNLPPVQPPSAGFILQLFLVPGLIVLVVIGVWALFGRMASSEQNWETLLQEVKHSNEHRRWRGAMGFAQLLQADRERGDAGEHLATNTDVAESLAGLLESELESKERQNAAAIKQQAFLARTLGFIDVPKVVLPVLQKAMNSHAESNEHTDLRKNAIGAIAIIAGRAAEQDQEKSDDQTGSENRSLGLHLKQLCETPELIDDLIALTNDDTAFIRQLATYTLALFPIEAARNRLEVLLGHPDSRTRINAAIGLARQQSKKGLPIFQKQFEIAVSKKQIELQTVPEEKSASRYFWAGISAAIFLLTAVWSFGTTHQTSRLIAAVLCIAAISSLSWNIYDLVQNQPTQTVITESELPPAKDDKESLADRRKRALQLRHEQLVVLKNSLKAVTTLNEQFTADEKAALLPLIRQIAKKHPQKVIRTDADKAVTLLEEK